MNKNLPVLFSAAILFVLGASPAVADSNTERQTLSGGTAEISCNTSTASRNNYAANWILTTLRSTDLITDVDVAFLYDNGDFKEFQYGINNPSQTVRDQHTTTYPVPSIGVVDFFGDVTSTEEIKAIPPFDVSCFVGTIPTK